MWLNDRNGAASLRQAVTAHPFEDIFRAWAKPPSETEEERCEHARSVVQNAVNSYAPFSRRHIEVFAQGSYRNGTNVRIESDVDICVRCMDACFVKSPPFVSMASLGLSDSTYSYPQFKNDVEVALKLYLGNQSIRGKKAIHLRANSYRVEADVVPAFEHRLYYYSNGALVFLSGAELRPDDGGQIINWPNQNCVNGDLKNSITRTRYKKIVRILKRLRNEMEARGAKQFKSVPSYLVECLVWNAPDTAFGHENYADDLNAVLLDLYERTKNVFVCTGLREVNQLKALFGNGQPWTQADAHAFVCAALQVVR